MIEAKKKFIGYDSSSNTYKLYNHINGKVISRDVEFDEESNWNWSKQEEDDYNLFPLYKKEQENNGV